jgi:hypothetical protein
MSLNLSQILPQISRLGESIAERRRMQQEALPTLKSHLEHASEMEADALNARLSKAGDRWPGAAPCDEPINAVFPAPSLPETYTIIGADGSQIYPDRHALAFYYLINIGSISVTHGSQDTPLVNQASSLFYTQDDLYDQRGKPIQPAMVNLRRDVGEMQALATAAKKVTSHPALAILDNSLLLWMTLEAGVGAQKEIDLQLRAYLEAIDTLRDENVSLAGFIDRPRNANVLALTQLAGMMLEDITPETVQTNFYPGLVDYDLFRTLIPAGSRSARFTYSSPLNRDFETAGHQIQFFYLNPGPGKHVVRVEIPAWVGQQPALLNNLHAGLLHDCQTTGGFPYVLVRAHELAVVNPHERETLERYLERRLLQAGDTMGPSQKSITKGWTQNRRRHRL